MLCKVICSSLGYETRVYKEGEYVEISSPSEVKRLFSYGVIERGVIEEEKVVVEQDTVEEKVTEEKKIVVKTSLKTPPQRNKIKKR